MRRLAFLLFVILRTITDVRGQVTHVRINLVDAAGTSVSSCNVKIEGCQTRLVYGYFNMQNTTTLDKVILAVKKDDSLNVFIGNMTYSDTLIRIPTGKETVLPPLVLRLKDHILKEIKIKGPPLWRQGDTTNFRVDAYKEGDEKKLKDIIQKLPGFNLTEDGGLTYKNRPVTRILIDGQEIFADKIKLLLASFPTKAIEILQAQENQNENKLLKASGGTETFLNLTLKKGTFMPAFGDFEAGAGDKGRYTLNPVIFSVNKFFTAGYIGNINSIGRGLNWNTAGEVKSAFENETERLMTQSTPLGLIQEMPESYYLKNKLFDDRIDLNGKLSDKLNVKTTISVITDQQSQQTVGILNYFDGNTYNIRSENNKFNYNPTVINIGQVYDFAINPDNGLQIKASWYGDYSNSAANTVFGQDSTISFIHNRMFNQWTSFNIQARFTHLNKNKEAAVTLVQYNSQRQNQNISSFSPQWAQLFQLEDPAYNTMFQNTDNHYEVLYFEHKKNFKIGRQKLNTSVSFKNYQMELTPEFLLSDTLRRPPLFSPPELNNNGNYRRNLFTTEANGIVKMEHQRDISYKVKGGFSNTHLEKNGLEKTVTLPELNVDIAVTPRLLKPLNDYLDVQYLQQSPVFTTINDILLPGSITTYRRAALFQQALKSFSANYNCSLIYNGNLTESTFSVYFNHHFNNIINAGGYENFFYFQTDSLSNRASNDLTFRIFNKIPSLLLQAVLEIEAIASYSPFLFGYQGQVFRGLNTQTSLKLSIKKNWNKKYYITLSSFYTHTGNERPAFGGNDNSYNRLDNFTTGLKQRLLVTKELSITANTQLAYNSFLSNNSTHFLLLDAEASWKLKNTPLNFTLRGENLGNRKSYLVAYNGNASQSVNTIPLIGRNFFISASCEF